MSINDKHYDPSRNGKKLKVLLIEGDYHAKYPPLGLLKISAYHKKRGDHVEFYKGGIKEYISRERYEECIKKIEMQGLICNESQKNRLKEYLGLKRTSLLRAFLDEIQFGYIHTVEAIVKAYSRSSLPLQKYDRVYVATLFTFYWQDTLDAIELAKLVCKSKNGVYVGGILATLIPDILAEHSGLTVGRNIITGLLNKPNIFDDDEIVIDNLPPDYSITDFTDYKYPLGTGFLAYTTRGCKRTCKFCAVPQLEP